MQRFYGTTENGETALVACMPMTNCQLIKISHMPHCGSPRGDFIAVPKATATNLNLRAADWKRNTFLSSELQSKDVARKASVSVPDHISCHQRFLFFSWGFSDFFVL